MKILVVGSTNIDHIFFVNRFPKIGETIKGLKYLKKLGGKGANQAIAIAKLSQNKNQVAFFSTIGQGEKDLIIKELNKYQVNNNYLQISAIKPTGVANIFVSVLEKNNFIAFCPQANDLFLPSAKKELAMAIQKSNVVVLQLEVNFELVNQSILLASKHHKMIILNPSPASELANQYLKYVDWLILNETELEYLTNKPIFNLNNLNEQINVLKNWGAKNIIVTLGANGCYLNSEKNHRYFKPLKNNLEVIDPTGAGDAFVGGFVSHFTNHEDEVKALLFAMQVAEQTITKQGAQEAIPSYYDILKI